MKLFLRIFKFLHFTLTFALRTFHVDQHTTNIVKNSSVDVCSVWEVVDALDGLQRGTSVMDGERMNSW